MRVSGDRNIRKMYTSVELSGREFCAVASCEYHVAKIQDLISV